MAIFFIFIFFVNKPMKLKHVVKQFYNKRCNPEMNNDLLFHLNLYTIHSSTLYTLHRPSF